jgi:hypothetical protein
MEDGAERWVNSTSRNGNKSLVNPELFLKQSVVDVDGRSCLPKLNSDVNPYHAFIRQPFFAPITFFKPAMTKKIHPQTKSSSSSDLEPCPFFLQ